MKKRQKILGKIIDIDDETVISADKYQYILRQKVGVNKEGLVLYHNSYFTSLEACFQFIFEEKIKMRLIKNPEKNIQEIVKIHKEVAKWLKSIFRTVENPF